MRSVPAPLLPVFRSALQGQVLAALLLRPETQTSLTSLAEHVGAPLSSVHAEVERLVTAGILSERRMGRTRLLRANGDNPVVRPLTELVALTFGPVEVVRDAFDGVPGVERVVIFGSWAARYLGEVGPPPRDVDVLVVGSPARADVYDAADRAERVLGLPVQAIVRSAERYATAGDALLKQVAGSPHVTVIGDDG